MSFIECSSLFCYAELKQRWQPNFPRRQNLWFIMGCLLFRRDTIKPFWWETLVRLPWIISQLAKLNTSAKKRMSVHSTVLIISDAFRTDQSTKTRLLNVLMQLRKCVDHPYLFDGNHSIFFCDFSVHIYFNQQKCKSIFFISYFI